MLAYVFVIVIIILSVLFFWKYRLRRKVKFLPNSSIKQDLTLRQLKEYDGKNGKPIYIAVNGKIFDVTHRKDYYGPHGPYGVFAGRDATKGLAKFDLTQISDMPADLSDLTTMEMESVKEWELQFSDKYFCIGRLINENEEPSDYSSFIYETLNLYNQKGKNLSGNLAQPLVHPLSSAGDVFSSGDKGIPTFDGGDLSDACTRELNSESSILPDITDRTTTHKAHDKNDSHKHGKIDEKQINTIKKLLTSKLTDTEHFEARFEPLFKSRSISSITDYFNLPLTKENAIVTSINQAKMTSNSPLDIIKSTEKTSSLNGSVINNTEDTVLRHRINSPPLKNSNNTTDSNINKSAYQTMTNGFSEDFHNDSNDIEQHALENGALGDQHVHETYHNFLNNANDSAALHSNYHNFTPKMVSFDIEHEKKQS